MEYVLVRRRSQVLEAEIDGELVALDAEYGTCYNFNPTASRIWQLIEKPRTVSSLLDALLEEFEVDRAKCERDLVEALEEMCRSGLIESSAPLRPALQKD